MNRFIQENPGPALLCLGLIILLPAIGLTLLGAPATMAILLGGFVELLGWMIMLKA